jgi:hypothetical protein
MLSDDEILGLWSEGKAHAPARPVLGSKKVIAFARAVERAAYERAAQECDRAFRKEWQREPLSDDYILDTANEIHRAMPVCADEQEELLLIARAVERAHGIGGRDDTK